MCGIAGSWDLKQTELQDNLHKIGQDMSLALRHRGSDAFGIWMDAKQSIVLSHRRLAILDLSSHGAQPMISSSGRYIIVFNGEVYNFLEIKKSLNRLSLATAWNGHSDTEVLLASIEALGLEKALQQVVGAFAFGLWDCKNLTLTIIRDRAGEKPLYFSKIDNTFIFASELKALRCHPKWQGSLNPNAVAQQLSFSYIPAPNTIYTNVYKVRPGQYITINHNGEISEKAYWDIKNIITNRQNNIANQVLPHEQVDKIHKQLRKSVQQQLIADVPVGSFLSGGVDSSLITAIAQEFSSTPINTFTIGYDDKQYNEANKAKDIAKHLGTEHTELYIKPDDIIDVISNISEIYDEPFSDSSQIPTFLLAKLARTKVTVCLSGDGGDELFGGYNRYIWVPKLWKMIKFLPPPLRQVLSWAIDIIEPNSWDALFSGLNYLLPKNKQHRLVGYKLHKFKDILPAKSMEEMYNLLVMHWGNRDDLVYGINGKQSQLIYWDSDNMTESFAEQMMYLDFVTYLPNDILTKVDRATMHVGLESRIPFLDHNIVELAWQLPCNYKIDGNNGKKILRNILNKYVPSKLTGQAKMGFGLPIGSWLRGRLRDWAEPLLNEDRIKHQNILNHKEITKRWHEHLSGKKDWQYHLWDVLMLQAWLDKYI